MQPSMTPPPKAVKKIEYQVSRRTVYVDGTRNDWDLIWLGTKDDVAMRLSQITDLQVATKEGYCELCGLPMRENEKMFRYHGYSESCEQAKIRMESV